MRISDWSSDVCSSDLLLAGRRRVDPGRKRYDQYGYIVGAGDQRLGAIGCAVRQGDRRPLLAGGGLDQFPVIFRVLVRATVGGGGCHLERGRFGYGQGVV